MRGRWKKKKKGGGWGGKCEYERRKVLGEATDTLIRT